MSLLDHVFSSPVSVPSQSLVTQFLTDRSVASVCSSSAYAINSILKLIDFAGTRIVIEYGPGNGAITLPMLERLGRLGKLVAFESNLNLGSGLAYKIPDPRLHVLNCSAEFAKDVCQASNLKADVIVSGVPFSLMDDETVVKIIKGSYDILSDGGTLVVYQTWLPPFFTTSKLQKILGEFFVIKSSGKVIRNLPPLEILECKKLRRN